jgi:hypothetical protein
MMNTVRQNDDSHSSIWEMRLTNQYLSVWRRKAFQCRKWPSRDSGICFEEFRIRHATYPLGRFRTSTKMITKTKTSSLCEYVRPNHDVISRHFVQTSSWRSKRTWFCWFASICGHFPLENAIPFDYLKKNWWRVRYRYRIRASAKPPYWCQEIVPCS